MATCYDRKRTMLKGKAGKSILALLLMMLFMFSVNLPAVMAEEVTDEEVTPVEMVTPSGSATVAEVVEESGSGDIHVVEDDHKSFQNDAPSVTITETYVTNDTSDADPEDKIYGMEPTDTTYTLTDTGEPIDKNSQAKVNTVGAEVKVEASEPAVPEAPEGSTETQDPQVTITKTTVTKSENAISKAVKDALSKANSNT